MKVEPLPVGIRARHLVDRRVCGVIEEYEFPNECGRLFLRCDEGMGYWMQPSEIVGDEG